MKKNNYLPMLRVTLALLLTVVGTTGWAADKTVKYSFKGRTRGIFLKEVTVGLNQSGDIPGGVEVGTLSGFNVVYQDAEGNEVAAEQITADNITKAADDDYTDLDNLTLRGFAGNTTLFPQYVVERGDEGIINLLNFKYKITDIQWSRRSRINFTTSRGQTWVKTWNGATTLKDGGNDNFTTAWELLYHERDFVDDGFLPFTGVRQLHIKPNSKFYGSDIAMKYFKISYVEPTLSNSEITFDSKDAAQTVSITLNDDTKGAFTLDDICWSTGDYKISSANTNIAKVTADKTNHKITVTSVGAGSTYIIVNIMNNGSVASTNKIKVTVNGQKWNFESKGIYSDCGTSSTDALQHTSVKNEYATCYDGTTSNRLRRTVGTVDPTGASCDYSFITSGNDYEWSGNAATLRNATSQGYYVTSIRNSEKTNYGVAGVGLVNYNQQVPAYSDMQVQFQFETYSLLEKNNNSSQYRKTQLDFVDFGQSEIWPRTNGTANSEIRFPTGDDNDTGVFLETGTNQKYSVNHQNPSNGCVNWENVTGSTDGYYTLGCGRSNGISSDPWFENSTGTAAAQKTEYLALYAYKQSITLVVEPLANSFMYASLAYTARQEKYKFYKTLVYDKNDGTGTKSDEITISCETGFADNVNSEKLEIPTTGHTEATLESSSYYTRSGYQFVGWNTKADGTGTMYAAGAKYCCLDVESQCGQGPTGLPNSEDGETLYAIWREIPSNVSTTNPTNLDWFTYTCQGEGGTFATQSATNGGESVLAVTGHTVATCNGTTVDYSATSDGQMYVEAFYYGLPVTDYTFPIPTRNGYTFKGYKSDPDATEYVVGTDGKLVTTNTSDTIFISNAGKTAYYWAAKEDVTLYADWELTSSTTYTITLDPNGGYYGTATKSTAQKTLKPLIKGNMDYCSVGGENIPQQSGKTFAGYYTAATGGDIVYDYEGKAYKYISIDETNGAVIESLNSAYWTDNATWNYEGNITLYAHWIDTDASLAFHEGTSTATNSAYYKIGSGEASNFSTTPTYEAAEYPTVTITRKLSKTNWNTVCLPFDVYEDQVAALFSDVEMFNGLEINGTNASMKFTQCDVMMAGVPYFVKLNSTLPTEGTACVSASDDSNVTGLTFTNVATSKAPTTISKTSGNTTVSMIGEYNTTTVPTDALFLKDNSFYVSGGIYDNKKVTGKNRGFRCYFTNVTAGGAKSFNFLGTEIDLEGYDGYSGTTGIGINPDNCTFSIAPTEVYDLSGRKLTGKPAKGVYIMNGKKYIAQ